MPKAINDNQEDLFGRTQVTEYVPCVKPPFVEISEDFIADRLLYAHDAALSDEKPNYNAAIRAIEVLAKMRGLLDKKEEKTTEESLRKVVFEVISGSNTKAD